MILGRLGWAVAVGSALVAASVAHAVLKILKSGSPISSSEVLIRTKGSNGWIIDIRPVGSPGSTIRIEADGTSEPIDRLTIRPVSDSGVSTSTNVFFRETNGGTIDKIGRIDYVRDTGTPGEIPNWLALNIEISGDIGVPSTLSGSCHADTVIEAHQIAKLDIGGDVLQDITLISDSLKSDGVLTGVNVAGDFLGDVFVPGDTRQMWVDGDIGQSGNLACIEAGGNIEDVRATNVYATST